MKHIDNIHITNMSNATTTSKNLSAKALALISEFALVLYRLNGTLINVDAHDVLTDVINNAKRCSDKNLRMIHRSLVTEINAHTFMSASSPRVQSLKRKLDQIASGSAMAH